MRRLSAVAIAIGLISSPVLGQPTSDSWDGLLRIKAKRIDAVYLLPDADFRGYSKVMIDNPEIAFRKDWQRDQNRSRMGTSGRITDAEMRKAIDAGTAEFARLLGDAYRTAGYQLAEEAGPDVLRLSTAVINVWVAAPERMTAGRSRTYSQEAGEATLIVEVRDSLSGEILGRAIDRRMAGDNAPYLRTSVSNRADFEQLFRTWAKLSANGLTELKAHSPVDPKGRQKK